MVIMCLKEFAEICRRRGETIEAEHATSHVGKMIASINKHGWDGAWFLRAYDYCGMKVGSKENEEGKIFIEPQGFCVLAGIGLEDGRARLALEAVKKYLDCEQGIVLNQPAFPKYHIQLGEISTYC